MTHPVLPTPADARHSPPSLSTGGGPDRGVLSAAFQALLAGGAARSVPTGLDPLRTIRQDGDDRGLGANDAWVAGATIVARADDDRPASADETDRPALSRREADDEPRDATGADMTDAHAADEPRDDADAFAHDMAAAPATDAAPAAATTTAPSGPASPSGAAGTSTGDPRSGATMPAAAATLDNADAALAALTQRAPREPHSANPAAGGSSATGTARAADGLPAGVRIAVQVDNEAAHLVSQPLRSLTPAAATAAAAASAGTRAASTSKGEAPAGGATTNGASSAGNSAAAQGLMAAASPQAQTQTQGGNANLLANGGKGAASAAPASAAASGSSATGDFSTLLSAGRGERGQPLSAPASPSNSGGARHASSADQVSVHITRAIKGGLDRVRIQLQPEALGRVEVKLEFGKDGRVHATITAETREAVDLLRADARGLERALQDAGVKADSNSLSFSLRGEHQDHAGGRGGGPTSSAGGEATAENDETAGAPALLATTGGITADGRVDIRA